MRFLDTDFLIAILRGDNDTKPIIRELEEEGSQCTTAINAFELYFGAFLSASRERNLKAVEILLSRLNVLPINIGDAKLAGQLAAGLKKKGERLDFRDVLIASIALSHNSTVVTRNVKHYSRIHGLKVEKW